jgi:hypothetical protein
MARTSTHPQCREIANRTSGFRNQYELTCSRTFFAVNGPGFRIDGLARSPVAAVPLNRLASSPAARLGSAVQ